MKTLPKEYFLFIFACLIIVLTAAPIPLKPETAGTEALAFLPLSSLAVPEELGKVQERFAGHSTRTIIQIQDVHAHAAAQQNIAAILERLRTVFGVEKTALEGAWSVTSLPRSHALPTSREKQLLAGTLLEDDRISGPVYAAIMSPDPITLVGIEEKALYEKNRALFLSHLGEEKGIEGKLQAYGASLQSSQKSVWGPELLLFGNAFGKFRETSDLGKFFPVLLRAAETQNAGISDLAQITLLRDIMSLEKSFVKERLETEVKQITQKYKNTPWTLEELIRGGKIPAEEIGLYPEIKKLTALYKMRDQVSLRDLTDQIGTLTGRILEKLVKAPEESALWEKTERFYLAEKLLLLQATPSDLEAYDSEKSLLVPELAGAGLSEALALSADFYDTVKKRDEVFFEKIMNDPQLADDIAIVTGGFHTDGLSKRFRDAGISYITVSPDLGGTAMNEKLYNARMQEEGGRVTGSKKSGIVLHPSSNIQGDTQSATLSELQNAIAWIDERFFEALKILFQTKDVRKAVKVFRGETVAVSKGETVRDLAARKRLKRNVGPETVSTLDIKVSEFMALPREKQLSAVREWQNAAESPKHSPILISTVGVLKELGEDQAAAPIVRRVLEGKDPVALLKDAASPEYFPASASLRLFEDEDLDAMLTTPGFKIFAQHHPPVIVKNGYANDRIVVLSEHSSSLVLYRIITLSESLYRAAKNPEFLLLLESLLSEILSQELAGKSV